MDIRKYIKLLPGNKQDKYLKQLDAKENTMKDKKKAILLKEIFEGFRKEIKQESVKHVNDLYETILSEYIDVTTPNDFNGIRTEILTLSEALLTEIKQREHKLSTKQEKEDMQLAAMLDELNTRLEERSTELNSKMVTFADKNNKEVVKVDKKQGALDKKLIKLNDKNKTLSSKIEAVREVTAKSSANIHVQMQEDRKEIRKERSKFALKSDLHPEVVVKAGEGVDVKDFMSGDKQIYKVSSIAHINVLKSGTGEKNTASNVGSSGFGLFYQKVNKDLQFRNIRSSTPNTLNIEYGASLTLDFGITNIAAGGTIVNTDALPEGVSNFYWNPLYISAGAGLTAIVTGRTVFLEGITSATIANTDALAEGVSNFYWNPLYIATGAGLTVIVTGKTAFLEGITSASIANTDALAEGVSNFYYRGDRFAAGTGISIAVNGLTTTVAGLRDSGGWDLLGNSYIYSGYSSAVDTGEIIVNEDVSGLLSTGMKFSFSQTTDGQKYAFLTGVSVTGSTSTLTIYLGNDYDLDNEAITVPKYSMARVPYSFPIAPSSWVIELVDSNNLSQDPAAGSTWYNLGSLSIDIPVGDWMTSYSVLNNTRFGPTSPPVDRVLVDQRITLSTVNNDESDVSFTTAIRQVVETNENEVDNWLLGSYLTSNPKTISNSVVTPYYLNSKAQGALADTKIQFLGGAQPTIIRARCAYL